jgi:hypothetical protein
VLTRLPGQLRHCDVKESKHAVSTESGNVVVGGWSQQLARLASGKSLAHDSHPIMSRGQKADNCGQEHARNGCCGGGGVVLKRRDGISPRLSGIAVRSGIRVRSTPLSMTSISNVGYEAELLYNNSKGNK